jgi:phosphoglycerol transferase MdoB-like AlkP superfamily enzyme
MMADPVPTGRGTAPGLRPYLAFLLASGLLLWLLCTLLRLLLMWYNRELAAVVPLADLVQSFRNGVRFDLRLVAYACLPGVLALLSPRLMAARGFLVWWLTAIASLEVFLALVELDFYREFQQRLNSLVFQYLNEDPATVVSMLWHGYPVLAYIAAWLLASWALFRLFARLADRCLAPRPPPAARSAGILTRGLALVICGLLVAALARGTLAQGAPLRWGAAYTTDSLFANQLGLNATLSLVEGAKAYFSSRRSNIHRATLPAAQANSTVRAMLVGDGEQLVDAADAAVRREATPPAAGVLRVRNVVVILMESFAGHYVGALGGEGNITPNFDALAKQGLLFTRFFSNGTHTHQGMFASMACFPNLPGFEYLMQQPEGAHRFSGLPRLLDEKAFASLYVYNGDFAWDNQAGFFRNQGLDRFVGRGDFVDPVFTDPTWGVSDQDMFDRALEELAAMDPARPFYALLQTLSNHTPYALPVSLPVAPVTGFGHLDEHLTAMRYSDWALGRFFERARQLPQFDQTLFVVVGDHGFGTPEQLTDMNLYRYYVPLLLIAPGIQDTFGDRRDTVGTQVDIVPTVMGRLGMPYRHQCWGRDLLALPPSDPGFGVIKPSGSDQTVAIIKGDLVLVQEPGRPGVLYRYRLQGPATAQRLRDKPTQDVLHRELEAYLQAATRALLDDTAGPD